MKRIDYESPTLEVVRISCSGMVATSPGVEIGLDKDDPTNAGISEGGGLIEGGGIFEGNPTDID